ncbi:unnamed protein product [Didymodactylos carnosus]|uniref:TLDc domain-containing protein n=1 Tax=Didymodactylos carnosus TaxID=1234261 RepID=A0A815JE32_9BILA|nr:unnamed protein product [Didymodactylos carnosus]CAF4270806.1 unnamed protein product [Didymodactylos carnosus]
MATSFRKCEIGECKRNIAALCRHCNKDVCKKHFNEHLEALKREIYPITDQINELANRIHDLNHASITEQSYDTLSKWKDECHKVIDQVHDMKKQEIDIFVEKNFVKQKNEQVKAVNNLKEEIKQIILEDDITQDQIDQVKQTLRSIQNTFEEFKQNSIHIKTKSLKIDRDCILIDASSTMVVAEKLSIVKNLDSIFIGSSLLSRKQQVTLNEFYGNLNQKWQLIYQATRDGFNLDTFHHLCDNISPTVTIYQSNNGGYLFGGYTKAIWNIDPLKLQEDSTAFLFTLTNPHSIPPTKYKIKNRECASFMAHNYGPTFGGGKSKGSDIFVRMNENTDVIVSFPNAYVDTTNRGELTFTGSTSFLLSNIEMFRCI